MVSQVQSDMMGYTNLKHEQTAWVFLLATANDAEDRHLLDLIYCLEKLLIMGGSLNDIFIFADIEPSLNKSINNYLTLPNCIFKINGSLNDFINLSSEHYKNFSNMLLFIIGHGYLLGLILNSLPNLSMNVILDLL